MGNPLDRTALRKLAEEKAQRAVEHLYPPELKDVRQRKFEELAERYFLQMITPPR